METVKCPHCNVTVEISNWEPGTAISCLHCKKKYLLLNPGEKSPLEIRQAEMRQQERARRKALRRYFFQKLFAKRPAKPPQQKPPQYTSQHTGLASLWFVAATLVTIGSAMAEVNSGTSWPGFTTAGVFCLFGYLALICSKLDRLRGRD